MSEPLYLLDTNVLLLLLRGKVTTDGYFGHSAPSMVRVTTLLPG